MSAKRKKATRAEEWYEESNSMYDGTAHSSESDKLGDLLLDLCTSVMQVSILLHEASPEEWRAYQKRIQALRVAIDSMPEGPAPLKKVGFSAE